MSFGFLVVVGVLPILVAANNSSKKVYSRAAFPNEEMAKPDGKHPIREQCITPNTWGRHGGTRIATDPDQQTDDTPLL